MHAGNSVTNNDSRAYDASQVEGKKSPGKKKSDMPGLTAEEREALDSYADFFNTLFEETQMFDVDEIVAAVTAAAENKNRLNEEVQSAEKEIYELESAIEEEKKKMQALRQLSPEEAEKLKEVHRLEDEIARNEETMKTYDKKTLTISSSISSFKVAVL